MLRYRNELRLSREQVQTLERLRADFQREATRRDAEIRSAETDLTTLVEADPVDLERVEAKLRAIERLRADLRLARIRTIEEGKAALTQEQRAKFRSLLTEARFRTYPPGERF
jgi:Spy/CpxP family protein refolding chaperone